MRIQVVSWKTLKMIDVIVLCLWQIIGDGESVLPVLRWVMTIILSLVYTHMRK